MGAGLQAHDGGWLATPSFSRWFARAEASGRARDLGAGPDLLVCLDIDGTVLGHDGSLSPRVHEAVAAHAEAGTHVVLATGRSIPAVVPVAHWLGLTRGWAVCSNGAVTIRLDPDLPGGFEVVQVVTFDAGPAVRALLAEEPGVLVAVEDVGVGFRVTAPFPAGELLAPTQVVDVEELLAEPVARVTLRAPGKESHLFHDLVERSGLHGVAYAVGWTAWLDLTPEGISKASALEGIRERLGVEESRTVAAGDGQNDREMLTWASLGVAMGSADAGTIEVADAVTGHVEEDGLVDVLQALLP